MGTHTGILVKCMYLQHGVNYFVEIIKPNKKMGKFPLLCERHSGFKSSPGFIAMNDFWVCVFTFKYK